MMYLRGMLQNLIDFSPSQTLRLNSLSLRLSIKIEMVERF